MVLLMNGIDQIAGRQVVSGHLSVNKLRWVSLYLAACGLFCTVCSVFAQSTAFTYQGQLSNAGSPANGVFNLRLSLYDSLTNASGLVAGPVTNSDVLVSNGLFITTVDFGPGAFTGADRWLQIDVSPGGTTKFTTLTPARNSRPRPMLCLPARPAT